MKLRALSLGILFSKMSFEEFLVNCRTYTIIGHFRAQGTHTNCVTVVMFKFRGNVSVWEYREGSYYRNIMR